MAAAPVTPGLYEAIVASSEDAILSKDVHGTITSWNQGAERLYGHTEAEAIGKPISILIPPRRAGEERQILDRIIHGERIQHYETERVTKDGRTVHVSLSISPIWDDTGRILGASVIARDVTEQRRALERAERLRDVTERLSREIRPERTVEVLLENAVPALGADAGAVAILDKDRTHLDLAGSAGYSDEGVSQFQRMPLEADLPMTDVARTGEALWLSNSDELWSHYPDLPGSGSAFSSLAIVPLAVGEERLGAVSVSFNEPHEFAPEERAFMIATAAQAAHALERGRLFDAERRRLQQLAFIAEASQLLVESLDIEPTLQRLASLAVPRIGDWCSIDLATEDGGFRNVAVTHVDPARVELAEELQRRYPPEQDADTGVSKVIRTGEPEIYPTIPDEMIVEAAIDEEHLRLIRELGMVSAMVVPLIARDKVLGTLTLVSAESGHTYTDDDLRLAQELAIHAGLAIDNATLYRREHDAAVTLQRALLPKRIPAPKTAEVAVRYLPAAAGLEVGGDWYDLVEAESGELAIVVGDVAGSGIKAAAVMGNLRTALRAYILDGQPPAAAVERLDALMFDLEEPSMATLVYLTLDPVTRRVEYVRAGHPPPLLRDPRGQVHDLNDEGSPPVGVASNAPFFSKSLELEPDSLLLLYTDGLIERRGEGIEAGVTRLRNILATAPEGAEECAEVVIEKLGAQGLADDAALVALRFLGS
jgi:PAS domain S-box-containing protein